MKKLTYNLEEKKESTERVPHITDIETDRKEILKIYDNPTTSQEFLKAYHFAYFRVHLPSPQM